MSDNQFSAIRSVARYAFAMIDAELYLDAYPDDREALAYYAQMKDAHAAAAAEYEREYGPLTADSAENGERWTWVDGPWPWQTQRGGRVCGRM